MWGLVKVSATLAVRRPLCAHLRISRRRLDDGDGPRYRSRGGLRFMPQTCRTPVVLPNELCDRSPRSMIRVSVASFPAASYTPISVNRPSADREQALAGSSNVHALRDSWQQIGADLSLLDERARTAATSPRRPRYILYSRSLCRSSPAGFQNERWSQDPGPRSVLTDGITFRARWACRHRQMDSRSLDSRSWRSGLYAVVRECSRTGAAGRAHTYIHRGRRPVARRVPL
ncbi:hypothetical protein BD310DRAFT_730207 [Dichomitus squalens]|uniref:Uncharacterized protein n=1 Tax=Dichomitus squalens TaxID=114155 RepID=A0A4Q9PKQ6_9APHY|nr:hypothetical protein BD310DRAFT_730207 [Dichomitus squalens]